MLQTLSRTSILTVLAAAMTLALAAAVPAAAQHDWPIEAGGSDHPMGNSFGEYQNFGGTYQHTGIDILEDPKFDAMGVEDPAAPWALVTVGGTISSYSNNPSTTQNGATIAGTDGVTYRYWHFAYDSYHVDFVNAFNNGTAVAAGDEIAKLYHWSCDFHHLHYDLSQSGDHLDPLADITPNPDPDDPEIEDLGFAVDNSSPWSVFSPTATGACTVVSGAVDLVAQIRDQDDAGSTLTGADTLWTYDLRWRACPDSSPGCAWQSTYTYDDMPTSWGPGSAVASVHFSTGTPWVSDSNYCAATWLYGIATNYVAGAPNAAGNWDTTAIADDSYSVSVEATDFAGNTSVYSERACVQNSASCTTELVARDATDDTGAIPYSGSNWWASPDLTVNPGTPDEDHNVNVGVANTIEVRVWNYGSCSLPSGTAYDVCLGWGPPSSSVAHPLPAAQQIGCQSETVPGGGWAVGASRVTTFTWTPSAATAPSGHACLVAWVDSTADGVLNTSAVNWDDNRVQENVTFQPAPAPGVPGYSSFWLNPQETVTDRSLELVFRSSGRRSLLRKARLHVGPGLFVERVTGGDVIGGYEGEKPVDPCEGDRDDPCRDSCTSWKEAFERGCTRIIGGLDPAGRLRLDGLRLERPVRLTLEVWTEEGAPKGGFADVDVIEYGRPLTLQTGEKQVPVGGLTVRFELGRR